MTSTVDHSPPDWSLPCWVDGHSLYFQLSTPNGPYVLSFQRHELGKALALLFCKFETEGHGEQYIRPPYVAKNLAKDGIDQRDLDAAAKALRELGILK